MKVREVLGVDFRGDRLSVVQLRQEDAGRRGGASVPAGPRPVLTHCASQAVPAGAESAAVAAVLRKMLDDGGFTATAAVLGLPRGRGFLRCQDPGRDERAAFSPSDYAIDGWTSDDGRKVLGVASRSDVSRLVEIAHQAGLTPTAVELRSLGCVTALGLLGEGAGRGAVLGVVLGESDATAALVEGQSLLAVQTRLRRPGEDRLDRWNDVLSSLEQMFRLAKMTHPAVAAVAVRVIVNAADRDAAKDPSDRLGVPVELIGPGDAANLRVDRGQLEQPAEYAAAVGLALEALQDIAAAGRRGIRPVGRLNFLRAHRERRRRRALSWRHAAAAAAAAIVIALASAAGYAVHRRARLGELQGRYDRLAQDLGRQRQTDRRWQAAGPWLGRADGGRRVSHRRIYDAVIDLFPSKEAYLHRLEVRPEQEGVVLNGRARRREVVHEFVSRLNRSPMFARASLGPIVDDAEDSEFPTRFSVTFHQRHSR